MLDTSAPLPPLFPKRKHGKLHQKIQNQGCPCRYGSLGNQSQSEEKPKALRNSSENGQKNRCRRPQKKSRKHQYKIRAVSRKHLFAKRPHHRCHRQIKKCREGRSHTADGIRYKTCRHRKHKGCPTVVQHGYRHHRRKKQIGYRGQKTERREKGAFRRRKDQNQKSVAKESPKKLGANDPSEKRSSFPSPHITPPFRSR